MTLEAHYTIASAAERRALKGVVGKVTYVEREDGRRDWLAITDYVTGKKEGRKVAKDRAATPWNF